MFGGYGYGYYFDPTILILIPAFILSMWAQHRVTATFNRYSNFFALSGLTAEQAARRILDINGLQYIKINRIRGNLTDHFNPKTGVISLSDSVYGNRSVAAIGVAAHEVGHAIQHAHGYTPIKLRSMLVPVANLGSNFGPWLAIIGMLLSMEILMDIGIIFFLFSVIFYLVTLPVEFNASNRAAEALSSLGFLTDDEIIGAKKVLRAAGMTYVASAAMSISSLLRLLILTNRRRD